MFRLSHVCRTETSLFHELMKIEKPTLAKVVEVRLAWENANKSRDLAVPKMTYKVDVEEERILTLPAGGCNNCGLVHSEGQCSAINRKCFDCGRFGHLGRVCRARSSSAGRGHSPASRGRSPERGRPFRRDTTPV